MNSYICFIDSGLGGVNVLNETLKLLPNEKYIYFADNKNAPFGNKTAKKITNILIDNIKYLSKKYPIKLFVLACNTATATSINTLRKVFPNYEFVGIEPAIKPAILAGGKTLVMTTYATYKNSSLIFQYKQKFADNLFFCASKSLAKVIDCNVNNKLVMQNALQFLNYYKDCGIKNIVLGCTHYNLIKDYLCDTFGDVNFFESSGGVAKRIKVICSLKDGKLKKGAVEVVCSLNDNNFSKLINSFIKN